MSKKNVYVRDESRLHNVPTKIISTMPIFMLLMIVSLIVSVVMFILHKNTDFIIWLSIMILAWGYGKFVDLFFNFYNNYKITVDDNKIIITYDLDKNIYSEKDYKATISIKRIDKIHKKRNQYIVYGDIERTLPRQRKKSINKVSILLKYLDNREQLVKDIETF